LHLVVKSMDQSTEKPWRNHDTGTNPFLWCDEPYLLLDCEYDARPYDSDWDIGADEHVSK
jgi:hypothetical protein